MCVTRLSRVARAFLLLYISAGYVHAGAGDHSDLLLADEGQPGSPIIMFVHGRGQSDKTIESVEDRFIDTFSTAQRSHFGRRIVPDHATRFVWYADTIDPEIDQFPKSANCQFQADVKLGARFLRELRQSLIRVAQAAGLDDIGLSMLAGDTYKYLTEPAVRCEADSRVERAMTEATRAQRPIILVAHSMGGIVAYSAIEKNASVVGTTDRASISHFITLGTQVGLPEVLEGLYGGFTKVPVPLPNTVQGWMNFINAGDKLAFPTAGRFKASDELRLPVDARISATGYSAHGIQTYLSDVSVTEVIVGTWCDAHSQPPDDCALLDANRPGSAEGVAKQLDGVRIATAKIARFLGVDAPAVEVTRSPVKPTGVMISTDDRSSQLTINLAQLEEYRDALAQQDRFDDAMMFSLAHEVAHIAQARRRAVNQSSQQRECEADIWGGIALVNLSEPSNPGQTFERVLAVVSLAGETGELFPIGSHVKATSPEHPDVVQRALCAARGISAGLNLVRSRQLAAAGEDIHDESNYVQGDPDSWFPREDPWVWSLRNSGHIVGAEFPESKLRASTIGLNEILTYAKSAELGFPTKIALTAAGAEECRYLDNMSAKSIKCTSQSLPSGRIALAAFDNLAGMTRSILLSRGWNLDLIAHSESRIAETFSKAEARSTIALDLNTRQTILEFASE